MTMANKTMTIKEVADFLQISLSYAYELAERPDFPAVKLGTGKKRGKALRVDRDRFLIWWEKQLGGNQHE